MNEQVKTGTTTVGIVAKDAIILAADMRATSGNFIADKRTRKVLRIADHLGITFAGSVSDLQLLAKVLTSELRLHEIRTGRRISVKEAANLLSGWVYNIIRRMSTMPGVVHFIMGGYDSSHALYDVFPDGSLMRIEDFVSSGSGSVIAYGVLESQYKEGLSVNEARDLAVRAINAALQRDSASGGGISVAVIDKNGYKELMTKLVPQTV